MNTKSSMPDDGIASSDDLVCSFFLWNEVFGAVSCEQCRCCLRCISGGEEGEHLTNEDGASIT